MSNKTRAVIWDMDGVIADTAPYHFKAWQEVFRKRGVTITEDDFKRNFGQRNDRITRIVLGTDISPDELESVATEKEESFRNRAKNHLKPLPGAVELIKSLKEYGFLQALGSSAPPENVRLITRELKIESLFQVIVSGREVKEGKPSPLGFLLAAEKLGVEPKDCIVIEDAIAGVAAARKAGMHCLAVTNTNPRTSLKGADLIVDSLKEVTPGDLESLLDHSN
ncbi:MAG: HAD family phosphatase [Dehalococcoidales bacterium]|nr:HAD family phosphatase [Dehalococcoidales bacterium]